MWGSGYRPRGFVLSYPLKPLCCGPSYGEMWSISVGLWPRRRRACGKACGMIVYFWSCMVMFGGIMADNNGSGSKVGSLTAMSHSQSLDRLILLGGCLG